MKDLAGLFTENRHFNVFYALLLILAASLPFTTVAMLPIAILMLINWIAEWNWREKWKILREERNLWPLILFTLLYLVAFIGVFISTYKGKAWADMECKLWLFVAPLIMLTTPRKYLNKERICKTLFLFSTSTILHLFVLILLAAFRSIMEGHIYFFYYVHFSVFAHPSYLSMYVTMTFFMVLYFYHQRRRTLTLTQRIVLLIIMAFLVVGTYLLRSKAGILIFCIVALMWFFYLFNYKKLRLGWSALICVAYVAILVAIFNSNNIQMNRLKTSFQEFQDRKDIENGSGSTQIRLSVWKSAWEVSKKNMPLGVGNGDVYSELQRNALENNYLNLIKHNYNAHSQYLQSLLSGGILGAIALLVFVLFPFVSGFRRKNILYITFGVILCLNILVESMLEVRAGVGFLAVFNVLLYLLKNNNI